MSAFSKLLSLIQDGMKITIRPGDCVPGDGFLIFSAYEKQTVTLHTRRVPYRIDFDADEPMLLENCPDSFFRTLIANIEKGNCFVPVKEPVDLNFFQVVSIDGVKMLNYLGYCYKSSNKEYANEGNPGGVYWANVECGFTEPLESFIRNIHDDPDYVDNVLEGVKQYQEDLTPDRMTDVINSYFNGNPPERRLRFEDLTMQTPCGSYVN